MVYCLHLEVILTTRILTEILYFIGIDMELTNIRVSTTTKTTLFIVLQHSVHCLSMNAIYTGQKQRKSNVIECWVFKNIRSAFVFPFVVWALDTNLLINTHTALLTSSIKWKQVVLWITCSEACGYNLWTVEHNKYVRHYL